MPALFSLGGVQLHKLLGSRVITAPAPHCNILYVYGQSISSQGFNVIGVTHFFKSMN